MGGCIGKPSRSYGQDYAVDQRYTAPLGTSPAADADTRHALGAEDRLSELSDLSQDSPTRFSSGQSGGSAPRRAIVRDFASIRSSLLGMQEMKAAPDGSVMELDHAFLPVAVKAENERSADKCRRAGMEHVPVSYVGSVHALCASICNGELGRARVVLRLRENRDHVVAADVSLIGHAVSILVVEPVDHSSTRKLLESCLGDMARLLPPYSMVSVLMQGSQKSKFDCAMFALHSASKMLAQRGFFDQLHWENVAAHATGQGGLLASQACSWIGPYRMIEASTILPAVFYKHAQSNKAVAQAFGGRRNELLGEAVNKRAETLAQRLQRHRDFRLDFNREVNTSIETKRVEYVERARAYARNAPDGEVESMASEAANVASDWFRRSHAASEMNRDSDD